MVFVALAAGVGVEAIDLVVEEFFRGTPAWLEHGAAVLLFTLSLAFLALRYRAKIAGIEDALVERKQRAADLGRETNERRQAQAEVQLLGSAIDQADESIVITDTSGAIRYVNPAFTRITGYTREEALGQNPRLLKSGTHDQAFYEDLWGTITAGGVWSGDVTNKRKNGSIYIERTTITPVRDGRGDITHFVAIKQDVTEHKKTEELLERMKFSIDHSGDAVLWADGNARFVYVNLAACQSLGYSREELLAMRVPDVLPEFSPDDWSRQWSALKKEGPRIRERRYRRKDGSMFPVEVTITSVEFGGMEHQCAIARDVSQRKRSDEALRESEERHRSLFDGMLEGVAYCRMLFENGRPQDFVYLEVNRAFETLTGLRGVVGRKVTEVIPGIREANPELFEIYGRVALTGQPERFETYVDPLKMWFDIAVYSPEREHFVAVFDNITEPKIVEEQLRQAQKMEAVGRLAGGVAHDFNNILGVILGYSEMLLKDVGVDDRQRTRVGQIQRAAGRAASLTRQLLAFSRKQILEVKVVDLNSVVSDAEKMLRHLIGEDIDVAVVCDPELGQVRVDPGQIEQVILNLAVNARDAMPNGGKLTIETSNVELDGTYARRHPGSTPGRYVMLVVSDTGCGMDAETQKHIFEPFFTTKEQGKGTGLGLATVYGVVKQCEGSIWVYSELGQGTAFKIYLPRLDERIEVSAVSAPLVAPGCETILLVEDEPALRQITQELLEASHYTVLTAADGAEAIATSRRHKGSVDLLLTDVIMPGMSGRELAKELSSDRPQMGVLYMSGYTDNAIVHHGVLEVGMLLLSKPFTGEELARKVREALRGRPGS